MEKLKLAVLVVLFDALFPLAAFMMSKPFTALTPLFQRGEISQAALSACQWACIVIAAVIFAVVVSIAFNRSGWVPAVLAAGALVSAIIVAFDRNGELFAGLSAIRVLFIVYLISIVIWMIRKRTGPRYTSSRLRL